MPHGWMRTAATMLAATMLAGPAAAGAIVVMTPANISSALAQLRPGDTLQLQGNFTTRVTIRNRDFGGVSVDGSRAVLEQGLELRNIHNITFGGLTVGRSGAAMTNRFGINLHASTHVSVADSRILGNGGSAGTGVRVSNSEFVTVRDTLFHGLLDGMTLITSPNSLITRNRFESGGSDGLKVVDSQRIILSGNSCTGFSPQPNVHPDCIQFWSTPGRPLQSDIYVLNNSLIGHQQGFASFDPSAHSGTRFTFAGNYAATGYVHGLTCLGCTESRFFDNVVASLPDSRWAAQLIAPTGNGNQFANNLIFDLRGLDGPLASLLPARLYSSLVPSIAGLVGSAHDDREWRSTPVSMQSEEAAPTPEPASWMMMLFGFALVGRALRRRQPYRTVMS